MNDARWQSMEILHGFRAAAAMLPTVAAADRAFVHVQGDGLSSQGPSAVQGPPSSLVDQASIELGPQKQWACWEAAIA